MFWYILPKTPVPMMRIESNGARPRFMEGEGVAMLRMQEVWDEGREEWRGENRYLSSWGQTWLGIVIRRWEGRKVIHVWRRTMRCANWSYAGTIGGIDLIFHALKFLSDHQRT